MPQAAARACLFASPLPPQTCHKQADSHCNAPMGQPSATNHGVRSHAGATHLWKRGRLRLSGEPCSSLPCHSFVPRLTPLRLQVTHVDSHDKESNPRQQEAVELWPHCGPGHLAAHGQINQLGPRCSMQVLLTLHLQSLHKLTKPASLHRDLLPLVLQMPRLAPQSGTRV